MQQLNYKSKEISEGSMIGHWTVTVTTKTDENRKECRNPRLSYSPSIQFKYQYLKSMNIIDNFWPVSSRFHVQIEFYGLQYGTKPPCGENTDGSILVFSK